MVRHDLWEWQLADSCRSARGEGGSLWDPTGVRLAPCITSAGSPRHTWAAGERRTRGPFFVGRTGFAKDQAQVNMFEASR